MQLAPRELFDVAAPSYGLMPKDIDVPHDVKEYPNVGHSFTNDWGPGPVRVVERLVGMAYCRPEAEDAWRRIIDFFSEHLR